MKKFNVKENILFVVSESFKNTIQSNVNYVARERNSFCNDRYSETFLGAVTTYNPHNKEVETFSVFGFCDYEDGEKMNSLINERINSLLQDERYSENQLIEILKASDYDYHSPIGYPNKEAMVNRKLKLENQYMKIYMEIIERANIEETISIDSLDLSIRPYNCLKRAGYNNVEQLKKLTLNEIQKVRNLGYNSIQEIEKKLNFKFV